jgi:TetR/AcrR family transcriptional repressor of nem operon
MNAVASESGTRHRIVEAADGLFYQRGFEKTSFADIAAQVELSRGNFYYHFKTKDEILAAVIALRAERTQAMLDGWTEGASTPLARLRCFAEMMVRNRKAIQRYGCPVGTLCAELAKLEHPAQADASMIFGQFRSWLREQFEALGHAGDADALAMHLLSRSQGIAALANAFHDESFIRREVTLIERWLQSLQPATATRPKPARKTKHA